MLSPVVPFSSTLCTPVFWASQDKISGYSYFVAFRQREFKCIVALGSRFFLSAAFQFENVSAFVNDPPTQAYCILVSALHQRHMQTNELVIHEVLRSNSHSTYAPAGRAFFSSFIIVRIRAMVLRSSFGLPGFSGAPPADTSALSLKSSAIRSSSCSLRSAGFILRISWLLNIAIRLLPFCWYLFDQSYVVRKFNSGRHNEDFDSDDPKFPFRDCVAFHYQLFSRFAAVLNVSGEKLLGSRSRAGNLSR